METKWQLLGPEGLAFFGKITASLTHEMKNALAIVNVNSGLLEDYMLMAENGMEVDPKRLQGLAVRIARQVERTDDLVSRLNAFAHSVDHPSQEVDLAQLLELAMFLSRRIMAGYGVEVEVVETATVCVTTSPFLLLNLICNCLFAWGSVARPGTTIRLRCIVDGEPGHVAILLEGSDSAPAAFPGPTEQAMLEAMQARLREDPGMKGRLILLPVA
ncbi:histidine kinase [Desulfolithobacter sp.]